MLNRDECDNALTRLLRPYFAKVDVQNVYHDINRGHSIDEDSNLLTLLIMEHFNNPPLKWDELKEDMWIWDSKECEYIFIDRLWISDSNKKMMIYKGLGSQVKGEFIEDRFYRKEVQE